MSEIIFRTRNPVILVSTLSVPPEENKSAPERHQFKGQFTEETLRKALYRVTQVPSNISLILGVTIFKHDSSGTIRCSFFSFHTLVSLIRLSFIIAIIWSYLQNREIYMKIFGSWGATEEFSHGLSIVSILICDTVSSVLTYKNVKSVESFQKRLFRFIVDVTVGRNERSGEEGSCGKGPSEYLEQLKKGQRWIERMVYLNLFFFVVSYASALKNAFSLALILPESRDNIQILATLPLLILYFIGVHILRQIAYYVPIGTITLLCFGISALKDLIKREIFRCKKLSPVEVEKAVDQLLEHFRTIYELVDEINLKHHWVLITGVISLLIIIICASFQLCVGLENVGPYTLLGTSSIVISNSLTFYCLCTVSSYLTGQAKRCMFVLRDFIVEGNDDDNGVGFGEIQMTRALKQKIRMWHMEGTMQPPSISPGYFFTLRRRIIPPIVAMLITYLLVLVQFQLKDRLENDMERGYMITLLKNHSLIV